MTRPRPTAVYFARCGQYVKVGCSANVPNRLHALLTTGARDDIQCPPDLPLDEPMVLLGTLSGGYAEEYSAHEALSEHRVIGEWFAATPALLDWIAEHTEPADVVAIPSAVMRKRGSLERLAASHRVSRTTPDPADATAYLARRDTAAERAGGLGVHEAPAGDGSAPRTPSGLSGFPSHRPPVTHPEAPSPASG